MASSPSLAFSLLFLSFFYLGLASSRRDFSASLNSPCSDQIKTSVLHLDNHPSKSPISSHSYIQSNLISSGLKYLMPLSIGTPPTTIFATINTAAGLILSQYNPQRSSTYSEVPCSSNYCFQLRNRTCGQENECQYQYSHNNSYSSGVLAFETFSFQSSENKTIAIPKLAFGRSFDTNGTAVVGLGPGPLSLVSQLGSSIDWKFSYYLAPLQQSKCRSMIHFGEASLVGKTVSSTPLIIQKTESQYLLTIKTISLGSLQFPVWPDNKNGKMVVDTSTPFTYLPEQSFASLKEALADLLAVSYDPAGVKWGPLDMCYLSNEEVGFIEVEMVFGFEGANMTLEGKHTFLQVNEDVACFAMLPSSGDVNVAVFGSLAQQGFYIGFDLKKKQLSFAPTDCCAET